MSNLLADLRFALRSFSKAPVFTVIAVLSLALGIGANTAIFTLLDQVLLRALPVQNPGQLVQVYARGSHYGSNWGMNSMSYPMYRDFRDQNQVFDGVICRFATTASLGSAGSTERVNAELVSGNYFEVLGIRPAAGRLITPGDDKTPGAGSVVVLGYDYWKSRFGGKHDILGQTVRINNYPMAVIGVAQEDFHGVDLGYNPQVLVPVTMKRQMTPGWDALENRRTRFVQVFARLRQGVQPEQAKASLQPLYKGLIQNEVQQEAFRNATKYTRGQFLRSYIEVLPGAQGRPQFRERFSKPLTVLMCIVGFVLLIACANVANLLLARATARQKEFAVRLAMGASQGRVIGQLLAESILLSLGGGIAGMALAVWLNRYLLSVMPQATSPLPIHADPDLRVFVFTFAVAMLTGVIFGLAPALQSTKTDVASTLKDQAGSVTSTGAIAFRKGLVVAQVTLSLLLLIGSGLFIRSLHNLKTLDPGFQTSKLVAFSMNPALEGYDPERSRTFYKSLAEKMERTPGVQGVAIGRVSLLDGDRSDSSIAVEGHRTKDGEDMNPWVNAISPGYFRTLGIPLVAGREFRPSDERPIVPRSFAETLDFNKDADRERYRAFEQELGGPPKVAVVNERFATYYFGSAANAVGRRFGFGGNPGTKTDIEIVGVVRDSMYSSLREQIPRQVFTPDIQNGGITGMNVYVRTTLAEDRLFQAIRKSVAEMDRSIPLFNLRTMTEQIERSLVTERMIAMLSAVFGILATLLATVGLYGVMACTVTRRTREIGIRMALGAFSRDVVWMVMREVLLLIGIGVAVGVTSGLLLTRYIEGQLFGLRPNDPATLAAAAAVLIVAAALAGYIPALRASRVDPLNALRYE